MTSGSPGNERKSLNFLVLVFCRYLATVTPHVTNYQYVKCHHFWLAINLLPVKVLFFVWLQIKLSKVICETTPDTDYLPRDSFLVNSPFVHCQDLPGLDLQRWLDFDKISQNMFG